MTYNVIRYPLATVDAEAEVIFSDEKYYWTLTHVADVGGGDLIPLAGVPPVLVPYGVKQAWELRTGDDERVALLAIQEADDDDDEA